MSNGANSRSYRVDLSSLPRDQYNSIYRKIYDRSFLCKEIEKQVLFVSWDANVTMEEYVTLPPGAVRPWIDTR